MVTLLSTTIVSEFLGLMMLFINYGSFTHTGQNIEFFRVCGALLEIFAQLIFLLLLMLLAQGWTITRQQILYPRAILALCVIISTLQTGFFFWRELGLLTLFFSKFFAILEK